jgi:hypothetical protein
MGYTLKGLISSLIIVNWKRLDETSFNYYNLILAILGNIPA